MTHDSSSQRSSMDDDLISLSEIMAIVLNGKWWIAGATAIFTFVAFCYLWIATPIYRADALVQVESQKSPLGSLVEMGDMLGTESPSATEIEVIRSRFVLGRVVESLSLDIVAEPDYFPLIGRSVARRFQSGSAGEVNSPFLWLSGFGWGGEQINIKRFVLPESLKGQPFTITTLEAGRYELSLGGERILIGAVGESAAGQNGRIRLFIAELQARSGTRFNLMRVPAVTAIDHLQNRLSVSEKGKQTGILELSISGPNKARNQIELEAIAQRYLRQNVERVSAEAQNSLTFLEDQLPQVKADLELAETRLNNFRLENQTVDLTLEAQAVLDQTVDIESQLAQLDIQIQQAAQRYTDNHPVMQSLLEQKAYMENQRKEFLGMTEGMPLTQQEVLRLARDVEVSTLVYTELLNKAQELKVVKASAVGNVRILDHAMSSIEAIKPKKALIAVLAILLGAMLGTGIVFVREMLRQGVKTPEEIESKTGLSVYATIPESEQMKVLERNGRKQGGDYLLAEKAPADLSIEALRSLRTNLAFALMESENNRIMITGPAPGVGKSFISSNLAALLAESGQKVLLIDADMRKGHINRVIAKPRENGLAECIVGQASLEQCVHQVNEKLDVLTCGHYPPNPSELLMAPSFKAMLEKASEEYDAVLIDTPPILAVTDPSIVGKLCGSSFMVVRAHLNPIREVEYAASRFEQNGIKIKGCVLNGMIQSSSRYGNYGYYQYSYS